MGTTTPKRRRDYRAEYRRRVERGTAKGLSLSQARGHPKANEKPVRKARPIPDNQFQISLKALRSGSSLAEAAKQIRVSPERFRNQAKTLGAIHKQERRWRVEESLPRQMLIYSDGQKQRITVGQFREASKVGRYMAAVGRFLNSNDIEQIQPFLNKSVLDRHGKVFTFETDPNVLYRLVASGSETFEQIYRIVV